MLMHDAEKIYFRHFFHTLLTIIEDNNKLQSSKIEFQDNKPEQVNRYTGNQTFGLSHWPQEDAQLFTAAVAQALVKTMEAFLERHGFDDFKEDGKIPDNEFIQSVHNHDAKISRVIIPRLVQTIDGSKPWACLPARIKDHLIQYQEKRTIYEENKSLFFTMATAAAAMAVVSKIVFS